MTELKKKEALSANTDSPFELQENTMTIAAWKFEDYILFFILES